MSHELAKQAVEWRSAYGFAVLDFDAYLDRLASADPTPGGGSAAALTGALGAALVAMVARITAGTASHPTAEAIATEADALRARLRAARPIDEAAYGAVVTAMALPKSTDALKGERTARLQAALAGAAAAPLALVELALELFRLAQRAAELRNAHLMSDVDCALRFARATLDASTANVEVNHRFLKDQTLIAAQRERLEHVRSCAHALESQTLATIADVR